MKKNTNPLMCRLGLHKSSKKIYTVPCDTDSFIDVHECPRCNTRYGLKTEVSDEAEGLSWQWAAAFAGMISVLAYFIYSYINS